MSFSVDLAQGYSILASAALAVACVLGWRVLTDASQMAKLRRWLKQPALTALPDGDQRWERVYADLYALLKKQHAEHDSLIRALHEDRIALEALPDGIVVLAGRDTIQWANAAAARHLDLQLAHDVGHPLTRFVRRPNVAEFLSGAGDDACMVLRTGGGAVLSLRLVELKGGHRLLHSRDITAEERMEGMRRDLVANVSHELKTPVTVIAGFLETLNDPSISVAPERRERFHKLMLEQARRMRRLVEDLLTLSRLESGDAPDEEQAIDLASLGEQLVEEARALSAGRHHVDFTLEDARHLRGCLKEIHSALLNLVTNAVRYTPEGGALRLAWRAEEACGVFSVADTGIGIEPQHIPRLTERFYRVDGGRSRDAGGTGLGLAIVKHVLTRHQARLHVTSNIGAGSTFSVVFPADRLLEKAGTVASGLQRAGSFG